MRSSVPADASVPADSGGPPPPSACDPATAPLPLYYRAGQAVPDGDGIDFLFKVVNHTGSTLPLSSLAIRYYFTNELTVDGVTTVFYADTCCGASRSGFTANVAVTLQTMPATATADHYLEITFDANAGTLLAGDAVQVEPAFHAPNFSQNVNQANDYSFLASDVGTQAVWDACPTQCTQFQTCAITVLREGVLMWGTAP